MNKKIIHAGVLAFALMLTSCGQTDGPSSSSSRSSSTGGGVVGNLANGTFDFSTSSWQEKTKIVAALEKYAMENHSAGIPIYDDASYQQFSKRLKLPSTRYLTNYGFGVGYGTINEDPNTANQMYDGTIHESNPDWTTYFHGYTNTDSGTFNGWDATGADVSDRMSMISSSYFGVKANAQNTEYNWLGSLSLDAEPIMLDEDGNVVDLSGLSDEEKESKTSQYWRVRLHSGEGYTYRYVGSKSNFVAKYDNRQVAMDDYLTPFREMLNHRLTRYAELVSDAGGLQGAMEYVYSDSLKKAAENDWTKSGVGVQISPDGNGLDFAFIQPKSMVYARTSLSSQLYSPVPAEFIKDVGIAKYGMIGSGDSGVFDNILAFGAYVPESWQEGIRIVFKRNNTYYEADDFHFNGYTEDVFKGNDSDEQAYRAFLANELDEVTIPTNYIPDHKDDPNVFRTEGSTIIKLNINSCTEEEWNYFFGPNGSIYPTKEKDAWNVKPIMSNEDFLNGMYFSINRSEYARIAGRNPAMGYLSNAYMLDPAGKVSYRSSDEGKGVLALYNEAAGGEENYGYSEPYAQMLFGEAARTLVENGTYRANQTIKITGIYRYQQTIDNIGRPIADDIERNFNAGAKAAGYPSLKLEITLEVGGSQYTDTYTKMDHGQFDYAEGAISGNVLNPLEFMNTLSSTKSLNQGFNLNWGHRTDVVSNAHPAYYVTTDENGNTIGGNWSYDALYNASQGFTPVTDGVDTPIASDEVISARGDNVLWTAKYPANATKPDGSSMFDFKASEVAVLTSAAGSTPVDGSYVSNWIFTQSANGTIRLQIPKEEIVKTANAVISRQAAGEKSVQSRFLIMFTLVYSIKLESGTVVKAKQIQTVLVDFDSVGIDPVRP